MDKKEEFKNFVNLHPELIDNIDKNNMTWQKFYELYDLYGDNHEVWDKYLNKKENIRFKKEDIITELTSIVKGIDLDSVQKHINTAGKAITIIQELTKKTPEVITKIDKPITKFYGD